MNIREAIDLLNDVIRKLYADDDDDVAKIGDELDKVRQFLGEDL